MAPSIEAADMEHPETVYKSLEEIIKDPTGAEHIVDKIVDHKITQEGTKYLVHRYGFRANDRTWEPTKNLQRHQVLRYWRNLKEDPPNDIAHSRYD